jgi:membrane protease YdiL (CAAX protease family)
METSANSKKSVLLHFLQFPLTRFVILSAIVFYIYLSGHIFRAQYYNPKYSIALMQSINIGVVLWMIGITLALYFAFVKTIEQRKVSELSFSGMGKEFGTGLLMGIGLFTLCIGIMMILGVYKIEGLNNWTLLLGTIWMGLSSGFFEEILFRGILLGIVEEKFGSWIAIVVSSFAFGLIHLQNPGATFQGVMFIAIEAGVLLAAMYIVTQRLWMGMGFHMAWNYTQSSVFAGIGTGNPKEYGLFRGVTSGSELLTGGAYGIEFSMIGLVVLTGTGIFLLIKGYKKGNIKAPFWKK